ncbi:unnamed protein product [Vitrella brassicaformis CCMP3155]|uniref:Polymerase nucleotidyl transferase domain-containing protein n=1 Tax=Vitrella brassicaformis (strain CCMP3155) TaxID=1169540 RepID=A0A0G4F2B0_VITBC|nr:unnamed protein product [Vitrella brassicaformis CCMP3155]|eukprot:CEM05504.1 unnamed protein product [Vitrella brassicaformis CCMP3155]
MEYLEEHQRYSEAKYAAEMRPLRHRIEKAFEDHKRGAIDDAELAEKVHQLSMRERAAMNEYEEAQQEMDRERRKIKHDLKQLEVRREWKEQEQPALEASSVSYQRDVVDDGLHGLLAGAGEGPPTGVAAWITDLTTDSDFHSELTPPSQTTPMTDSQLPSPRQHWYDNRPILSPVPPSRPLPERDARLSGLAGASAGGHSLELSASVEDTISKLREIGRAAAAGGGQGTEESIEESREIAALRQSIAWLEGRLKESEEEVLRLQTLISQQQSLMARSEEQLSEHRHRVQSETHEGEDATLPEDGSLQSGRVAYVRRVDGWGDESDISAYDFLEGPTPARQPPRRTLAEPMARRLRKAVHRVFGTDAVLFGSAAYKLALWESDVDLSAAIPADKADQLLREGSARQGHQDVGMLACEKLGDDLKHRYGADMSIHARNGARWPTVHCHLSKSQGRGKADVAFNNGLGSHKAKLLLAYMESSPIIRKLALLVKRWAKGRALCGGRGLTSLGWVLLVIDIQPGRRPPISIAAYILYLGVSSQMKIARSVPLVALSNFLKTRGLEHLCNALAFDHSR